MKITKGTYEPGDHEFKVLMKRTGHQPGACTLERCTTCGVRFLRPVGIKARTIIQCINCRPLWHAKWVESGGRRFRVGDTPETQRLVRNDWVDKAFSSTWLVINTEWELDQAEQCLRCRRYFPCGLFENDTKLCAYCEPKEFMRCVVCGEATREEPDYYDSGTWIHVREVCEDCIGEYGECANCGLLWVTNATDVYENERFNDETHDWFCCEDCANQKGHFLCDTCGRLFKKGRRRRRRVRCESCYTTKETGVPEIAPPGDPTTFKEKIHVVVQRVQPQDVCE